MQKSNMVNVTVSESNISVGITGNKVFIKGKGLIFVIDLTNANTDEPEQRRGYRHDASR